MSYILGMPNETFEVEIYNLTYLLEMMVDINVDNILVWNLVQIRLVRDQSVKFFFWIYNLKPVVNL